MRASTGWLVLAALVAVVPLRGIRAEGEAVNGFPNWSERVLLEWINRARADPQTDLAGCPAGNCPDAACYTPQPPRGVDPNLSHSARFHSDHMSINGYFDHPSHCTLVSNIASLYLSTPQSCGGAAACSCTQHMLTTNPNTWTDPFVRMSMFGGSGGGEIIAFDGGGPDDTFYLWLYEPTSSNACAFSSQNGHRYLILTSDYGPFSSGPGVSGALSTVDFGAVLDNAKIPSGAHYPQQAASVAAWVNWHDSAGPSVHKIDVDGVCSNMSLARGSQTNGAWTLTLQGAGSGCHRYFFAFKDSAGNEIDYPTTGSIGIGNGSAQCPDWSAARPAACTPPPNEIFADGFE